MKYRDIASILTKNGFSLVQNKTSGSHRKFRGIINNQTRIVIIPEKKGDLKKGTLEKIIRQSGLSKYLFRK